LLSTYTFCIRDLGTGASLRTVWTPQQVCFGPVTFSAFFSPDACAQEDGYFLFLSVLPAHGTLRSAAVAATCAPLPLPPAIQTNFLCLAAAAFVIFPVNGFALWALFWDVRTCVEDGDGKTGSSGRAAPQNGTMTRRFRGHSCCYRAAAAKHRHFTTDLL
jgi:hypothetical protein